MKRIIAMGIVTVLLTLVLSACGHTDRTEYSSSEDNAVQMQAEVNRNMDSTKSYTKETRIEDVANDPAFGEYGRLIFPADTGYYSGDTLGELRLIWYNNIDPDKTVEIVNYMKEHAEAGNVILYDIYTDEEKAEDPEKGDTGLFFFRRR